MRSWQTEHRDVNHLVLRQDTREVSISVAHLVDDRFTNAKALDANIIRVDAIELDDLIVRITNGQNEGVSVKVQGCDDLLEELKASRLWVRAVDPLRLRAVDIRIGDAITTSADIGTERK